MKETFKINCSQISKIMAVPRSKQEIVSQGAKTYCNSWLMEKIFDRRDFFTSKHTAKGNLVEDMSIDFASDILGMPNLEKNKQSFENEHMLGTPDVLPADSDLVIDMKNSWEFSSFPILDKTPPIEYWWQVQGYMSLTGRARAQVIFTLVDTPHHLIQSEARRYCFLNGYSFDEEILDKFIKRMTYADIDESMKIKVFDVKRDDEAIARICQHVENCRDFIKQTYDNF